MKNILKTKRVQADQKFAMQIPKVPRHYLLLLVFYQHYILIKKT